MDTHAELYELIGRLYTQVVQMSAESDHLSDELKEEKENGLFLLQEIDELKFEKEKMRGEIESLKTDIRNRDSIIQGYEKGGGEQAGEEHGTDL